MFASWRGAGALRDLLFGRWLLLALIALVALGGVAVACGDDDDDDDAAVAAEQVVEEQAAAQVEEQEALKIGFLADFSGPLAEFGPVTQTGVQLAIDHINAAGGVFGQDIILVTGDTQVDPTQGVEEARRLVEVEGVHAIVGPLSSTVALAVSESVTRDAGVPVISPSATSPALSAADDGGFLFRSTISDAAQGVILADLAADEGYDNVAVMFINDAYGQGLADAFEAAFGGTVTKSSFEDGQASYLAELQSVAGDGAQVLVAVGFPTQAQVFIREALENDIFDQFLFVDGTKSQELIDAIGGEFLGGSKGTAPGSGPGTPSAAAWDAAYLEVHDELPMLPFVREAYDGTIAIALAAQLAGSTDGTAIRDALVRVASPGGVTIIPGAASIASGLSAVSNGDDVNYEGVATSLDWDAAGDVTSGFVVIWQYTADGEIEDLEAIPFSLE